jgi:nucleotide-binding universal stress UspA family protein
VVHPNDVVPARGVRTILVPVDFSEESAIATSMAVRLLEASETGGRLILLHAVELMIDWPSSDIPTALPRHWDEAEARAAQQLESIAASIRNDRVQVITKTFRGYAPDAIEREAHARSVDLIAMGTQGRGGLDRLLLGSIAERVVHHSTCPVLTVRRPDADQPIRVAGE